jgi:hypothetical protein
VILRLLRGLLLLRGRRLGRRGALRIHGNLQPRQCSRECFVHLCICAFVHLCICASVHLCICAFVRVSQTIHADKSTRGFPRKSEAEAQEQHEEQREKSTSIAKALFPIGCVAISQ